MPTTSVVKIAVEQAALSYDKLYSYRWPEERGEPRLGVRVLIPFGRADRRRQGIVLAWDEETPPQKCKPVLRVLDEEPLLDEEMLALVRFMQERTFCSYFDAVRAILPTGLYMELHPVWRPCADIDPAVLDQLTPDERRLFGAVCKCPEGAGEEVLRCLGLTEDAPLLQELLGKGVLEQDRDVSRKVGDLAIRMVRRADRSEESAPLRLTEKQQSVLDLLDDVGAASVKEVCYFTGVTPAVVNALVKKGAAVLFQAEVLRSPYRDAPEAPPLRPVTLNESQQRAFDRLAALYDARQPAGALLYGVTGSGKTAVYMNLIDRVLTDGRQVIVLVPEISLTPQMMDLFVNRYGRRVAVLHSGLALGERTDEWKRIKRGDARVVVGTRSAVFAPCSELGLIVVDEEQEHTYKSESSPRYHARDVARFRCARHGALMLLCSATPSVESYQAALSGHYTLLELPDRYGEACLPAVQVVDMRTDPGSSVIGETLEREMRDCLAENRQVILLLNRRGYHTHVSCRSCGQVITCPSCSISMTYHRANHRLMCHYCGHTQPPPAVCPQCGSDKIRYTGFGTQTVEQELTERFPDVPVLRMDTDTTMSRFSYATNFAAFARGDYRIMIGTQMVAKGLDFPEVGLVGVLSADAALYGDDYRSYETTFSLLTQVIGRAGRRQQPGKAVIQTYTPDNPVIELAASQNYRGFYDLEIQSRRMMRYPPYTDLFLFGFSGENETAVRQAGRFLLEELRRIATEDYPSVPLIALDPTPAAVAKVAGKYRYKLLLKAQNTAAMRGLVRRLLDTFHTQPGFRGVTVFADVNPASML